MPRYWQRSTLHVLLALPLFLYLLVFTGLPLLSCVVLSFTDAASRTFLSWDNYLALFSSGQFGQAFRNTLWLTGVGVCLEVLLGLGMAHVLHRLVWGRAVVRTLVLTPLGIPTIEALTYALSRPQVPHWGEVERVLVGGVSGDRI